VSKAERERRQRLERGRRYRAEHAEERAAYTKKYREDHAEEIAAYRKRWREANLDHARQSNREYMRRRAAEERKTEERRQRKAAYSRARYHTDVEASRAKVREYLAGRRAADPEGFREGKKRRNDVWRARNRDEVNRRQREKKRLDPSANARRAQECAGYGHALLLPAREIDAPLAEQRCESVWELADIAVDLRQGGRLLDLVVAITDCP